MAEESQVDLQKYVVGHDKVEFTYQQVLKDADYADKSIMKTVLSKFDEKQLDPSQYDHEKQKMTGRAALLIIMKRTGPESAPTNKLLLDLIISNSQQRAANLQKLKGDIVKDIEKKFDSLKL